MKKLFLSILVLAFSFSTYAQEEASTKSSVEKGFSFGAKAGVNFSSISNLDETGYNSKGKTSFHVGALGQYSFNEKFAVQAEILYSEMGAEYDYNYTVLPTLRGGGLDQGNGTICTSYLSIPLLAKYTFIKGLSVEGGPQFSQLLAAKDQYSYTYDYGDGQMTESGEEDIKDDLGFIDIGAAVGLTYKLDFGLFFSARYVFGLTNIFDYSDDFYDYRTSSKNNVFQASAGYKFN